MKNAVTKHSESKDMYAKAVLSIPWSLSQYNMGNKDFL